MPVIGFNFSKMHVEKTGPAKGKISINNNVALKDVIETELNLGKQTQKGAIFKFEFSSEYEPKVASLILAGEVVYIDDEKQIKNILSEWKKGKKVEKDLMTSILNNVLNKCNIQALILSKDMNLPSPIPMPRVGVKQEAQA